MKLELLTIDAEDTVAPRFEVLEEPNEFVKEIDAKSGKVEQTERLSKMIQF
ncbi:hypothetical protein FACS1894166_02880 [Bacilli bacterium]|nr:hypothetical protein FACS1894166_02880 [Bacilli bacterium]